MIGLPARAMLRRWSITSVTTLVDQAIFSSVNFLLNILLARLLAAEDYGAFAIAYSLYFVAFSPYVALVVEPFHAMGAADDRPGGDGYLRYVLQGQLLVSLTLGLILVVAGLVLRALGSPVGSLLGLFGCVTPVLFSQMLLRWACYVHRRPGLALAGSATYFLVAFAGLLLLLWLGTLTTEAVPPLLGVAGAVALGVPVVGLRISPRRLVSPEWRSLREVMATHWHYGRWRLGSGLFSVVSSNIYAPAIGLSLGTGEAGAFRAVQNLFLPLSRVLAALAMPILPRLSRRLPDQGRGGERRDIALLLSLAAGIVLPYALVVLLFGERLIGLLYGDDKYGGHAWLLAYLAAGVLGSIGVFPLGLIARALRRFSVVAAAEVCGAASTLCVTLPLLGLFGLVGAATGLVVAQIVPAVVLTGWAVRRWLRPEGDSL